MKYFLLPVIFVASFCVSVSLEGESDYERNINILQIGLVNTMRALGETTIDQAPYQSAINVLEDAQRVVSFETQNPTIVAKNIKVKLDGAITKMRRVLEILRDSEGLRRQIAAQSVKDLKAILPGLKTGFTDIFKTPTDLKNALYEAVKALIATLEKFIAADPVTPAEEEDAAKKEEKRFRVIGKDIIEMLKALQSSSMKDAKVKPVMDKLMELKNSIKAWAVYNKFYGVSLEPLSKTMAMVYTALELVGGRDIYTADPKSRLKSLTEAVHEQQNSLFGRLVSINPAEATVFDITDQLTKLLWVWSKGL